MYSRPSSSTVNALARVPTPNSIDIIGSKQVSHSAHGRVLDFRSPRTLQENAAARASEVTGFIESLTKVAQPLIADALTKQANRQVGELLATQDPVALIRSADPEQRALVRSLSPQAQDILNDKAAAGASRLYLEIYQAERTKRSAILQSPTASPEEKAKAEIEAKGVALERSGVSQVEPSYLVKHSDGMIAGESTLKGFDYKETLKAQDENSKAQYRNGLRTDILSLRGQRMAVVSKQGDMGAWAASVKSAMETGIVQDSGRYTPAEQAQLWGDAALEELARLTGNDQWDEAITTVETLRGLAAMGVKTPAGIDFFDQKLQNGVSLRYLLDSKADDLEKGFRQFQQRQVLEDNRDIIRGALQGDPNAEVGFQQALQNPNLTAEQMMTLGQTVAQADNIGSRPTQQQQLAEAQLRYDIAQGGFNPEQMWERVKGSGLKPQQVLGLAGQITRGSDESTQLVAGARQYLTQETISAGAVIAEANGISDDEQVSTITRDLQNAASRSTEKRIADLQAAGESVTADRARDIYRNELEAIRNTRLKEAKAESSAYKDTPDRRVASELQQFQQNIVESKGQVTVMSFPKSVRIGFQQAQPNAPMTVPALEKYMMSRMQQVQQDGKPVYSNPQKTLQGIIRPVQQRFTPPGSPDPGSPYSQLTTAEKLLGKSGAESLQWLLEKVQGISQPSTTTTPSTKAKPTQNATKPQEQAAAKPQQGGLMQSAMSVALGTIANVIAPPAAAATREPEMVNQEALDILNKVWTKREPLRMGTPPLPQVAASTPTGIAPLAIRSDMHPIFVAIGISEGTRTANGGYTKAYYGHRDPGNGVWNVGTVSGQQGGSPRGSDQRWMARLTQQASAVAPMLQRVGLQPGTQGWNRMMFNVLDLAAQAPAAVGDFIRKLPTVARAGFSIEAIAKARADSFFNPATGRLEAGGFGNSYGRLFADQRSRAGVWDYRRRI